MQQSITAIGKLILDANDSSKTLVDFHISTGCDWFNENQLSHLSYCGNMVLESTYVTLKSHFGLPEESLTHRSVRRDYRTYACSAYNELGNGVGQDHISDQRDPCQTVKERMVRVVSNPSFWAAFAVPTRSSPSRFLCN